MVARSARRREQLDLARSLRGAGGSPAEIAASLRDRYRLRGLLAMRLAHGWTQAEVAVMWNARWPDDTRTFKNVSYWENWPDPTGYAPSLAVLDRLATLYSCDVADLVAGWGEHGTGEAANAGGIELEALAWQVDHLNLHELTRALADWSQRLPEGQRRALLLKLSTAAAVAAGRSSAPPPVALGRGPAAAELAGTWESTYSYYSSGRDAELEGTHTMRLRAERGRLVGLSDPTPTGTVELDLATDGLLVTGTWTERTARDGYYRGAVYHGSGAGSDPTGISPSDQGAGR